MVFPVVMYGCESWTIKKAERQRIDTFELWCWRRLLRGPWTARRSNRSILKEISPEYSLEGLMLKQQLQYFGHLMRDVWLWCWERLKAGEGDDRGWDGWMVILLILKVFAHSRSVADVRLSTGLSKYSQVGLKECVGGGDWNSGITEHVELYSAFCR